MRRIVTGFALLISLAALLLTDWLTGEPKTAVKIHATVPAPPGQPIPAGRARFDLMRRSPRSLLDSLCRAEVIRPPDQIVDALADEGRGVFLRGEIERRGFILSLKTKRALMAVGRARQEFLDLVRRLPDYALLLEAIGRVHGPLVAIPPGRSVLLVSVPPPVLTAEVTLYNPARVSESADAAIARAEQEEVEQRYDQWMTAVAEYDARYHRDLLERTIVAVALYRDAAVASVETDTSGAAIFPAVRYGRYWLAGHYPQDVNQLVHLNRVFRPGQPVRSGATRPSLVIWDVPVDVGGRLPVVELAGTDAGATGKTVTSGK